MGKSFAIWGSKPEVQGCHGQGKNFSRSGKSQGISLMAREIDGQGNLGRTWKVRKFC